MKNVINFFEFFERLKFFFRQVQFFNEIVTFEGRVSNLLKKTVNEQGHSYPQIR